MRVEKMVEQMPGNLGLPGLGRVWHMASTEGFGLLSDYHRYGPVFKSNIFGRPCAVLIGPEANRLVLQEGGERFSSYEGLGPFVEHIFGQPMMLQDGERHRRTRRLMAPAFHATVIASYCQTMQPIAHQLQMRSHRAVFLLVSDWREKVKRYRGPQRAADLIEQLCCK